MIPFTTYSPILPLSYLLPSSNLRQLLDPRSLRPTFGSYPCRRPHCKICPIHSTSPVNNVPILSTPMPLVTPAISPAPSVIHSIWGKPKIVCPLELMASCPPPTVPTIYPFRLQPTSNLTNSLLIPVGMYMYFITYPQY